MSLFGYKPKWGKAPWTITPSGKRLLRSAAARSEKSSDKREVLRSLKSLRPIRRERPEHAKARRIYNTRVKEWLQESQNKWCAVCTALGIESVRATQCHHKHGRGWRGEFLMVEELWIPVSAFGQNWIHSNEDKARALGLLAPKGEWNELSKENETL